MADGRRILVIEDDFEIRDVLTEILTEEGYQVSGASNGQEALERLRSSELPALILLDLMMPVMNGWQFRAAQLADPRLAAIPVMIVSADAAATTQKASALAPLCVLSKPIQLDRLLALVRHACPDDVVARPQEAETTRR